MTDYEQRRSGSLLKVLVNAWKLFQSLTETAKQARADTAPDAAGRDFPLAGRESTGQAEAARVKKGAWLVIGASLVWKGASALAHVFLTRPAEPGIPAAAAGRQTEEEKVRTGKWLMLGALLSWKAGKSLAKKTAGTFLEEPVAKPGTGAAGADSVTGMPVRSEPRETAWEELQASASGVAQAAKKALAESIPVEDLPSTGRQADRNLDRENGVNLEKRERWGTALVTFFSLAGLAGGVAFVVSFWAGASNQWLGGGLAVFFLGLGATLVSWAHWLTVHKEAVEPREPVASPLPEQQGAAKEFFSGAGDIQRRRLLQWMGLAGFGVVGSIVISLIRSLGFPPSPSLETDVWKRGQRLMTVDGVPVSANALQPGGMIIVFPESSIGSEKTQTVLVRVRPELVHLPAERTDWAPGGNLAYSRVCTHAGCSVGMYEANSHLLMCPCHQSTFNVLTGAQPTGGPAARALPQLPLYVDSNGYLRAASGFSDYPGPGFWGMPS